MNNKDPNESLFSRRGFYTALYAFLAVAIITTAAFSLHNLTSYTGNDFGQPETQIDHAQLEPVGVNYAVSYLDQQALEEELALRRNRPTPTPSPPPEQQEQPGAPPGAAPAPRVTPAPAPSPAPAPEAQTPERTPETPAPSPAPQVAPQTDGAPSGQAVQDGVSPYLFEFFDISQRMEWPALGEVVMGFSPDRLIYDRTLDQYRTNDTISIAAEMGSQVLAASAGIVEFVGNTHERGNYVVINHGNGWVTTYGQLQDGVLVRAGDVVRTGQPIGGIGSPTICSVLLGNHVNFRVENNGVVVDPRTVLR
ncbi:MAG: M23 family metallopeptidase [Defluviitaleaceae bacterium]|nr:M23 family metallopeptidase [Defluviitaleaceae bacterium]